MRRYKSKLTPEQAQERRKITGRNLLAKSRDAGIEIRDEREFRVTVLPEKAPRKRKSARRKVDV